MGKQLWKCHEEKRSTKGQQTYCTGDEGEWDGAGAEHSALGWMERKGCAKRGERK